MGKWTYLKGDYEKVPVDQTWLDRVNDILNKPKSDDPADGRLRDVPNAELAKIFTQAKAQKEILEGQLADVNLHIEAYTKLFVDRFDEDGVSKMTFDDGTTISINPEPYPTVKDREALLKWVRANGMEELLTLQYQTMAKIVKEAIEGGQALPDGVEVFLKDKLSRRTKGGKKEQQEQ